MRLTVAMIFMVIGCFPLHAADTEIKLFRPFGTVRLLIGEKHGGSCYQQSEKIKREDAWRCEIAAKILDPCFINPYGSHQEAVCFDSPWAKSGIEIDLAADADNTGHDLLDISKTYPWALRLKGGEKCLASGGKGTFDGSPIRYQCDSQSLLFGHLQRCNTVWSMLKRNPNGQVDSVDIEKAWF